MRAYERLLHYVSFGTQSDHTSETVPSTASQKVLAADLVEEMKKIGIADAFVDDKGYVYGSIPATKPGKRYCLYQDELDKWLETNRKNPVPLTAEEKNAAILAGNKRKPKPLNW